MLVLNDVSHDSRVRREAAALAAAGFQVCVIGTHDAGSPLPDRAIIGKWLLQRYRYNHTMHTLRRIGRLSPVRHLWQGAGLVLFLRRQQAAIWHAHDFPALVLIWLARLAQREPGKLVYDTHELYFYRREKPSALWGRLRLWLSRAADRWLAQRADLVFTTSPYFARFMAQHWPITEPIAILNGAIPPADVQPLSRPENAGLWLIHTGTMMARGRKLQAVLAGLLDTPADVHLTFIGDGPLQADLMDRADTTGLRDRVHFVPPLPPEAVSAAIRSADAAIVAFDGSLPGYALTLPNKLFEAIAAELPVLGARTPALEGFFADYPVGPLWEAADPTSLAQAITLLRIPENRRAWREACQCAQAELGWTTQAARLTAAYRQLTPRDEA